MRVILSTMVKPGAAWDMTSLCPVSPRCRRSPPVSQVVMTILVIRSTVTVSQCLCSSHRYFTSQWPQSARVVMLALLAW